MNRRPLLSQRCAQLYYRTQNNAKSEESSDGARSSGRVEKRRARLHFRTQTMRFNALKNARVGSAKKTLRNTNGELVSGIDTGDRRHGVVR
jgi:hypothetical protein